MPGAATVSALASAKQFSDALKQQRTPLSVLRQLEPMATACGLKVFGAIRSPISPRAMRGLPFYHPSVPKQFGIDFRRARVPRAQLPTVRMAYQAGGPFTVTECMKATQPRGQQRWLFDLYRRHGIRDALYCPAALRPETGGWCGERWVVIFWSDRVLGDLEPDRWVLQTKSQQAAQRLEQLFRSARRKRRTKKPTRPVRLSSREMTVITGLSLGQRINEIARGLGLRARTAHTYATRAREKLEAKTSEQACANAIRAMLIL